MTGRELARRTGVAQSYVSKIETGRIHPNLGFCESVSSALKLERKEQQSLFNLLAIYQAEHQPLSHRKDAIRDSQEAIRLLEESATVVRVYQPTIIPGLLQTPQYIETIFHRYLTGGAVTEQDIQKRIRRQQILNDTRRRFWFVMTETCFLPRLCGREIMRYQVDHLETFRAAPNISMMFLPTQTPLPMSLKIPMSGFEGIDDSIVITDTLNGYITFRHPDDVTEYLRTFDQLEQLAVPLDFANLRNSLL